MMLGTPCSQCCCTRKDSDGFGSSLTDSFAYANATEAREGRWRGMVEALGFMEPGVKMPDWRGFIETPQNGSIERRTYIEPLVNATIRIELDLSSWAVFTSGVSPYIALRISRGEPDAGSLDGHGITVLFADDGLLDSVDFPLAENLLLVAEFSRTIVQGQVNNEQWSVNAWANGEQVVTNDVVPYPAAQNPRLSLTEQAECFSHKVLFQGTSNGPDGTPFTLTRYYMKLTYA
jgi:hypothetical protein